MLDIWKLFSCFFKIGAFTFGSGYAMISLIEREVVDKHAWFEREDFLNHFTLAQSAPGPFSLNTAAFVGFRVKGFWGALFAVLGLVIPSFVIILVIAMYLRDIRENEIVNNAFKALRPCVVALIAVPCIKMFIKLHWSQMILAIVALVVLLISGISPVYLLLIGALLGLLFSYFRKS